MSLPGRPRRRRHAEQCIQKPRAPRRKSTRLQSHAPFFEDAVDALGECTRRRRRRFRVRVPRQERQRLAHCPGTCRAPRSGQRSLTRLTNRSAAVAVVIAFGVGMLGTMALSDPSRATPVAASGADEVAAAVSWRVPASFSTNLPVLGDNVIYVTDAIRAASGGRIALTPFEPGEIVPAFSITDAVREGKVPAGYTWLGYDQGKIPAAPLVAAVPFGMEPWEYSAWWFEAGGRGLAEALYAKQGVMPMLCGIIGPEAAGWFREPIERLEDLRGLKIRFAGLGGRVIERLGASVTMIPGGEIFQALEKGVIDATEYSLPSVDAALGFDRVAGFNYFPGWHQPFTTSHLVVNLGVWQALTPQQRATVEMGCTAGVTRNLARGEALQGPVLAAFAARGVETRRLPEPLLRELERVAAQVLADEASRDEDFRVILASQRAFRAEYAHWKQLAYLPRDF